MGSFVLLTSGWLSSVLVVSLFGIVFVVVVLAAVELVKVLVVVVLDIGLRIPVFKTKTVPTTDETNSMPIIAIVFAEPYLLVKATFLLNLNNVR
jgi:hypothetical protein